MPMLRKRSSAAPWNSIRYADDVLKSCKRTDKASSTVRLIWYFRGCFRVVDNRPGPHLLRGLATSWKTCNRLQHRTASQASHRTCVSAIIESDRMAPARDGTWAPDWS